MHQPIDNQERPDIEELQSGVVAREPENGDAYIFDATPSWSSISTQTSDESN